MRGGGGGGGEGEIVQVPGGHIIRATGRKDRHSKVYTAKGPRDRRVRLSAQTAIQFYDVQDRLGFDRPSKALDWLIKKAKSAIDKLAELPPFDPNAAAHCNEAANVEVGTADLGATGGGSGGGEQVESSGYEIQLQGHHQQPNPPAALVSASMAETMKSFFPASSAENPMVFHGYPRQDLCLSLQSFQNPGLIEGQSDPENPNSNQTLFSVGFEPGTSGGGGGGSPWPSETNPTEMGRFSRLLEWGGGGGGVAERYGGQRGTLQSSYHSPHSIRAWEDLPMGATTTDHQHQSMAGIGVLGSDGIMGFSVPAQMPGGGEDVHGIVAHHYSRASSISTDSSP